MTVFLATTKPNMEFKAVEEMKAAGLDAFTPKEIVLVKPRHQAVTTVRRSRHSKAKKPVEAALVEKAQPYLRGYAIIRETSEAGLWYKMNSVRYAKPMQVNGKVARISGIDAARMEALDGQRQQRARNVAPGFNVGDVARVIEGPFIGLPASIEAVDDVQARVTIHIFGRPTPATLAITQLERAA